MEGVQTIEKIVKDFKNDSRTKKWFRIKETKTMVAIVFDHLVEKYSSSMMSKKCTINFITKDKVVHCQPEKGVVEFGKKQSKVRLLMVPQLFMNKNH